MRINTIAFTALIGGSIAFCDAFKNARHVQKTSPAQVRTQDSISSLPNDVGSNPFKAADERALQATCSAGFVDCENGFVRGTSNPQVPCGDETDARACGGECCVGDWACEGFTGKICKDSSCSGFRACRNAVISEVINSCSGDSACTYAVIPAEVISSCKPWGSQSDGGERSCQYAGAAGGSVGSMVDSCLGKDACNYLGNGGTVGNLTNSCHGVGTGSGVCQQLGRSSGSVGDVTSSCYGMETCYDLGLGGVVGPVTNSCGSQVSGASVEDTDYQVMGTQNCFQVANNGASISEIKNCCRDGSGQLQCFGADTDAELIARDDTCATTTTTVASSWSLGHDAKNSGANFTSGIGDEGEVTSTWNLQGPDLSDDSNDSQYTLKTIIKKGFCSGDATAVTAVAVASDMVSGGLIDQDKVIAKGVGLTKTCSKDVTSDGSTASKECVYEFDKSSMNSVVGYDAATGVQKLCEIAQLQWNEMVIMEEYMNVQVTFNLTAGFTVSDVAMTAATIESSTAETSLSDYIAASQCGDNAGSIAPNQELCVKIESSSPDVLIKSVDEMIMKGLDVNDNEVTDETLAVIEASNVKYSAITSLDGIGEQTVTIKSMVPTSKFNFEDGGSLKITGSVTVEFDDGSRRLISLDRLLQANEDANEAESAAFDLDVEFSRGPDAALEDGDAAMMNSAKATAGKAFATLGMAFAFAFALW